MHLSESWTHEVTLQPIIMVEGEIDSNLSQTAYLFQ